MDADERALFEALLSELTRLRTTVETRPLQPSSDPSTEKAMLNVREAAVYLNTSRNYVYTAMKQQAIPCRKLGQKFFFRKAELDAWWAQLPGVSVERAVAIVRANTVFFTHKVRIEPPEPAEAPPPWPEVRTRGPRLSFQRTQPQTET
jgi:excisionase family DNA binding protein